MRPPADRAAVAQAHRARVARQLLQAHLRGELLLVRCPRIANDFLQLRALGGITRDGFRPPRVLVDHRFLSHTLLTPALTTAAGSRTPRAAHGRPRRFRRWW